jgi:hypothetical protein
MKILKINNLRRFNMVIYSQKMAAKLMLKGFILQGMEKNSKYPNKNIFYFNDTEELKKTMNELSNK